MKTSKNFIAVAKSFIGCKESDGTHKQIVDIYNSYNPLPRNYKVTYNDAWCAVFVSSVAIKSGCESLIPIECSCYYMLENARCRGIYVENDAYIPKPGDIILYDWNDNGIGDDTGKPNHVGIVTDVGTNMFTVIEGNKNNEVGYRTMLINGKYIRGFITPKFEYTKTGSDYAHCALDVLSGKYGNGETRRKLLTSAGYDPDKMQRIINAILS